jgi:hypothetical protein
MLDKSGLIIKTRSGYVQQSPLISIITTNMEIVTKLSREFGLTPASSRSHGVSEEKEDDLRRSQRAPRAAQNCHSMRPGRCRSQFLERGLSTPRDGHRRTVSTDRLGIRNHLGYLRHSRRRREPPYRRSTLGAKEERKVRTAAGVRCMPDCRRTGRRNLQCRAAKIKLHSVFKVAVDGRGVSILSEVARYVVRRRRQAQ